MISLTTGISRALVFRTAPTTWEPSTRISSTCTSEAGASLMSLGSCSLAEISAAGGSWTGLVAGGVRVRNVYATPATNIRQGTASKLQDLSFWVRLRLVRYSGSVGAGPPARRRSIGPRNGPSHLGCGLAAVCVPGFMPANTIDSRNFRSGLMMVPPKGLSIAEYSVGREPRAGEKGREPHLTALGAGLGEQCLEGAKIVGAAHHDQVVASLHGGIGGRVEHHFATFLANGHDDDAHLLAQLHLLNGLGDHLAGGGDAHLFDGDILADVFGGEVEELDDGGPQEGLREAMAGNGVRSENGVGAGAPHLGFGAFLGGAGGHVDARIEALGGEQHEEVVGVGGEGGDKAARALDAHEAERVVVGGIGGHGQHAGEHGALHAVGVDVDHDEGDAGVREFARGAAADASESVDNVVIFELVDHAFIPPLADGVAELEFDDGLGHGADGDEDRGDSEGDQEGIEDAPGVGEGMDRAVAHRGHGGQRHVESVEGWIPVDDGKAYRPDGERGDDGPNNQDEAPREPVHGDVWIKYSGRCSKV